MKSGLGGQIKFQIGKSGITKGTIDSLTLDFKKHKLIRISVLKSGTRDKKKIEEMAEEIIGKLKGRHSYKIVGFTIVMKGFGELGK